MSEPVVEVLKFHDQTGSLLTFECPGCGYQHGLHIGCKNALGAEWTWNGDYIRPTISPSILQKLGPYVSGVRAGQIDVCHSFVRDGQIEFLSDCTHSLAGRTVPLQPIQP